jgi:nicotinamidase/pyrazinamidase
MVRIEPETDVLVATDVQNDFCPGGALAVAHGDEVVPVINRIAPRFAHYIATQDWHPPGHHSFATTHDKPVFSATELHYGTQTLWPDHCVQGTEGSAIRPDLDLTAAELILRKGFREHIDSYSAFFENDRVTTTGLAGYLHERGLKRVFLTGLATDYCVAYSAIDAARLGFDAFVIMDATRAIDLNGSLDAAKAEMTRAGVRLIDSSELA